MYLILAFLSASVHGPLPLRSNFALLPYICYMGAVWSDMADTLWEDV